MYKMAIHHYADWVANRINAYAEFIDGSMAVSLSPCDASSHAVYHPTDQVYERMDVCDLYCIIV